MPTTDISLDRPEPTPSLTPAITGKVLFLVGENDYVVPASHQREIAHALREADIDHEAVVYPGVGHGFLSIDPATEADAWNRVHALLTSGPASLPKWTSPEEWVLNGAAGGGGAPTEERRHRRTRQPRPRCDR